MILQILCAIAIAILWICACYTDEKINEVERKITYIETRYDYEIKNIRNELVFTWNKMIENNKNTAIQIDLIKKEIENVTSNT